MLSCYYGDDVFVKGWLVCLKGFDYGGSRIKENVSVLDIIVVF